MKDITGVMAKKVGMSRFVDEYGRMVAVTILEVVDQKITKILQPERDGYSGYQVGYFTKSAKNLTQADRGRLAQADISECYARFCEFRYPAKGEAPPNGISLGRRLTVDDLSDVDYVDVSGLTKGRGFQGVVKRWGHRISSMSHGSRYHRRTGSLGNCTTPGRVMPGKKMPGRYGSERRTLSRLALMVRDHEESILAVKGAVPGNRGSYVEVRASRSPGKKT